MIVTIWGSSGSGKSMFAAALARTLAGEESALLISLDKNTPMLPVWLPRESVPREKSLGYVMDSLEINTDVLSNAIVFPGKGKQENLGVAAYVLEDTVLSFAGENAEKIEALARTGAELADVVILDCPSYMESQAVPAALAVSDYNFCFLSPDLRGTSFYLSAKRLLEGNEKLHWKHTRFLSGGQKPYHAAKPLDEMIGGFFAALPFHEELETRYLQGEMLTASKYPNISYEKALIATAEVILHE